MSTKLLFVLFLFAALDQTVASHLDPDVQIGLVTNGSSNDWYLDLIAAAPLPARIHKYADVFRDLGVVVQKKFLIAYGDDLGTMFFGMERGGNSTGARLEQLPHFSASMQNMRSFSEFQTPRQIDYHYNEPTTNYFYNQIATVPEVNYGDYRGKYRPYGQPCLEVGDFGRFGDDFVARTFQCNTEVTNVNRTESLRIIPYPFSKETGIVLLLSDYYNGMKGVAAYRGPDYFTGSGNRALRNLTLLSQFTMPKGQSMEYKFIPNPGHIMPDADAEQVLFVATLYRDKSKGTVHLVDVSDVNSGMPQVAKLDFPIETAAWSSSFTDNLHLSLARSHDDAYVYMLMMRSLLVFSDPFTADIALAKEIDLGYDFVEGGGAYMHPNKDVLILTSVSKKALYLYDLSESPTNPQWVWTGEVKQKVDTTSRMSFNAHGVIDPLAFTQYQNNSGFVYWCATNAGVTAFRVAMTPTLVPPPGLDMRSQAHSISASVLVMMLSFLFAIAF